TSGMGLVLGGRSPVVLTGHADASWADDQATQRSSQGYTFSLGSGSVSWRSTRSSSVLSSSCEAEIYAGAMAAQELRWLTYLLTDLGEQPRSPPVLDVDNKAMLALCREHRLEHRTKHIALRYFLARELQQRGQLRLAYVASEANSADIFTKALAPGDHQRFCTLLGLLALLCLTGLVTSCSPPLCLWGVVSRPSHEHLEAAKRLVRYVSTTASVGFECSAVRQRLQRGAADLGKGEMLLTCYTDASFNSVKADGTSIGGYVCLFGGGAVSWRSKKQNEVGLSSCETEYMALHHGAKEVVWLRRLLEEIGVCQKEPTVIFCDNESAVKLAKISCLHGLTKHIRPKWHWVRRLLDKEVRLEIVKTHQQAADILTKRLAESEHWKGMKLAGMSIH
ncbi:unnamed protein product, partial [Closterium sp. NIES-53]